MAESNSLPSCSGIYQIMNTVNGKRYIGSAVRIAKRWSEHRCALRENRHHSQALQRSWNKYGEGAFEFAVLQTCEKAGLIASEQAALDALKPELNVCKIAGSRLGDKLSPETKARIAASMKANPRRGSHLLGKRQSEETIAKRAVSLRAAFSRAESKALLSQRRREKWADPAFKERTSKAVRSALNRPEVRLLLSDVKRRQWSDPNIRIKWEGAINARWADPAFKEKVAASMRAARSTPESRAKTSEATKANWARPEYRAKHSASLKAAWARRRAAKEQQETQGG